MNNPTISTLLDQIADLLDFKGENPFRVNSYRKAARTIRDLREDVAVLVERGELRKAPGIGEAIGEKIKEFLATGQIRLHQELVAMFPATLPKLLEIPGLGPKKVATLFNDLQIGSIEELTAAVEDGRVAALPRFGEKTAEKIREGIQFIAKSSERTRLAEAWPLAQNIRGAVSEFESVKRVELAGSIRRGCETIGDIDLLCEAASGGAVIESFTRLVQATSVRAAGGTKGSILVPKRGGEIQVDLRVVPAESFGAAWQYFTGSKEHNVRLRSLALKRGWQLNEYGLFEDQKRLAGAEEQDIYSKLGLPYVPPELREDRGECDCTNVLPRLITRADIRGDLHTHTTASDGRYSIEEMAMAALAMGYEYLAITDHSRSSVIANGLSIERLMEHVEAIRRINKQIKGLTLLAGTECDILSDGTLDYPDDVLAQLDWVVASIHAGQTQPRSQLTYRTIAALENPYVCVIGHPSGRLLGKRDAMDLDWEQIFAAASRTGTALEINSSYKRLDLKDVHVRMAMDTGCWLSIDTDAHSLSELNFIEHGTQTGRRGWATQQRVLNARNLDDLQQWVAAKRKLV